MPPHEYEAQQASDFALSDVPVNLREQLIALLVSSGAMNALPISRDLWDALPLSIIYGIATNHCLDSFQIDSSKFTESRLRSLANSTATPVSYLESAQEALKTFSAISASDYATASIAQFIKCSEIIHSTEVALASIKSQADIAVVQQATRQMMKRFYPFIASTTYKQRDARLRAALLRNLLADVPGAIIFVGLDHVPDLGRLRSSFRVVPLCKSKE